MSNIETKTKLWISKALNLPALKKSRLHWVDYLKGIAILLVVYRHSLLGIQRNGATVPAYLINANMVFYSFRMPLFFILSGIFVSRSLAKRSVWQLIGSKFESLMYPYFIWAFIQITLQICLSNFTNASRGLIDYTYLFYQPRNLDQFWYLPALFNSTLVFLLIKKYITSKWQFHIIFGLGFYLLSPHLQSISMISDWMEFYIFFALGDAISRGFFKENVQRFLKNYITLLCAAPVFIAAQVYYLNYPTSEIEFLLIALIGCFTMIALAFRLQSLNAASWLRIYGFHSLYIYVMHVMIAAFVRIFFINVLHIHDPLTIIIACIAIGGITPVIIYNLFIFNKPFWFLFTYHKKKKSEPSKMIAVTGPELSTT